MENKLSTRKILAIIAISTVLLLIATQTIFASPNYEARKDLAKSEMISNSRTLCEYKIKELQQRIGDGVHTQEDLIVLSKLSTDGQLNIDGCRDLASKVLEGGLQ